MRGCPTMPIMRHKRTRLVGNGDISVASPGPIPDPNAVAATAPRQEGEQAGMPRKAWFITGMSRGLGHALAQAVLSKGDLAVGTTRDGAMPAALDPERLAVLPLDMTDRAQARRTAASMPAIACWGRSMTSARRGIRQAAHPPPRTDPALEQGATR